MAPQSAKTSSQIEEGIAVRMCAYSYVVQAASGDQEAMMRALDEKSLAICMAGQTTTKRCQNHRR
eukprot:5433811-Amphidinium_carterae.1